MNPNQPTEEQISQHLQSVPSQYWASERVRIEQEVALMDGLQPNQYLEYDPPVSPQQIWEGSILRVVKTRK